MRLGRRARRKAMAIRAATPSRLAGLLGSFPRSRSTLRLRELMRLRGRVDRDLQGARDKGAQNQERRAPTTPSLVIGLLSALTNLRKREASTRLPRTMGSGDATHAGGFARSRLSPPARDIEQRAGHIGRTVADQPDGRLGDFLSRAGAPHRSRRAQNACAVRLAAAGVDIGVDEPRADGVDPDALGAKFLGET
jgi:hypothetical protein